MDKLSGINQINTAIKDSVQNKTIQTNNNDNNSEDFLTNIKNALDRVSEEQMNAQKVAKSYEIGEENSVAKVMVEQQVSPLGFNMVLNVRNKVISAYRDIINMPV